ncbi:hypothetical protein THRCLA_08853 [Thraustotheca clavata]|uniref:Kinetochore protein NDC80 n=1 Tax=Thraustotheca clavata TaxID=74557 RepID=A0A1V9Z1G3_9STRA|nr:hypothetical protein THRCLA_08853 [Thraustotheca clavata]
MRRTTLGPITSSQLNTLPPSRVPVASGARQSISVMPQRRESVKSRLPPSRSSLASNRGHSIGRNGSVGSGRRSSAFGVRGSRTNDPRPISDRGFMNNAIRMLVEFLTEHNYEHPINSHLLFKPMKKDFIYIMQFLFKQLDRSYEPSPKFEDDIAIWFRHLRYPFPISKTALAAVGSPHSWPTLLAAIKWLIDLLKYHESTTDRDEMEDDIGVTANIVFEYLADSYKAFLSDNDDECKALQQQMVERFATEVDVYYEDINDLRQQNEEILQEIEEHQNEMQLDSFIAKKRDCQHDREKLLQLVEKLESNKSLSLASIQSNEHKIAKKQEDLRDAQAEIIQLQKRIDTQQFSAEDVDRMEGERHRMQDLLEQFDARYKELQSQHWEKETEISKMKDVLEEDVKRYMNTATRLKFFGKYAQGVDYALSIDAQCGGAAAAAALMNHLRKYIAPNVYKFRRQRIERLDRILDKSVELKAQVDSTAMQWDAAYEALRNVESQERKGEDALRREKENIDAQLDKLYKAVEDVELDLERVKSDEELSTEIIRSDQAVKEATDMYEVMKQEYEREISTRLQNISLAVSACIAFKENIEKSLIGAEHSLQRLE